MKKFIITEEEKSRILEMHKSATSRQYLMEQSGTTKPQLGGGAGPSVMAIPGIDKVIVWTPNSNQYRVETKFIEPTLVNYLGGERSMLSGIIGKTIPITGKSITQYQKEGERFGLPDNNVDSFIITTFVPKAWYVGAWNAQLDNTASHFLYLFSKEITTNYSGNIEKPILENGVAEAAQCAGPPKQNLIVPTKGGTAACFQPLVDDNKDVVKVLKINRLVAGTDYIKIRYDGYCPELKGYADYLRMLGIPALGTMAGVTKV